MVHIFSSEICEIFKSTFENSNNAVEHLWTGARLKCYLEILDYIISYSFESFRQIGDDFFMAVKFIY